FYQISKNCVAEVRSSIGKERRKRRYGAMVREANQPKRVEWAEEQKLTRQPFINHWFCDEASVQAENESMYVLVDSNDPYAHVTPAPKNRYRVMIWIGISMMGATEIKILGPKETIKSEEYCRIIEEYYMPAAKQYYGNRCYLVHDNAPVHVSAHTKKRLEEMGVKVTEKWPAESPDCNPVELVFAHLKDRLRNQYKPKNRAELVAAIKSFKEVYLTPEYCRKTIKHIHTAIPQVIRRKGLPVRGKKD
ncbi:hypothetical protein PFISCL1PPCAC_255, partial [Pristionchus fissidentatus]